MFLKIKYIFGIVLLTLIFSCQTAKNEQAAKGSEKLYIVCTTQMLGDLVSNIAGDAAIVETLMGPGVDPHYYKATQGDLKKLEKADAIVYNGLHLEGKMQEVFEHLAKTKVVITATQNLPQGELIYTNDAEDGKSVDPHVWHDVELWTKVGATITANLNKAFSEQANNFTKNFESYSKKLSKTHKQIKSSINRIPKKQRILITSHDAFSYYGKQYGVEVNALQGISTVAEYGLRDIVELTAFIVEHNVKTVFVESSVSDKSIKAVVEGCAQNGHEIKIGGYLYSDAMGAKDTKEGTYIGMIMHNTNLITEGLK